MGVCSLRGEHHEIFWAVVSLVPVYVVYYLPSTQRATEHLFGNGSVYMPTPSPQVAAPGPRLESGGGELLFRLLCHTCRIQLGVHLLHVALAAAIVFL